RRTKEIVGLLEVGRPDYVLERGSVVTRIEQVEGLKVKAKLHPVPELEILGDSQIHLHEFVASLGARRELVLIVSVAGLPVIRHPVLVYVAREARRENAVRTRGRRLEYRRELEAPRQIEDPRHHKAMTFVRIGRSVVCRRVELVKGVDRRKTKVAGHSVPCLRSRQRVVRIQ